MRSRIVLISCLVALAAAGCGGSGGEPGADRSVVAAFYPLAFAAQQVASDAEVTNLTPAGAEPHDLELSARDVERVREADLVLYLAGFMPALDDAITRRARALDLLDGLELLEGADDEHGHGDEGDDEHGEDEHGEENETDHGSDEAVDPHVWLDPMRFAAIAERIAGELGDPEAAATFVSALEELDDEFREGLAGCQRRTIVTSHAAFGYLADAYGLEQIALTGVSPEGEPSARAIEELVAEVKEEGATTVFFETLVSPALAETVAREAGVTTAVLNPLEGLTQDEIDAGADYFGVMRDNLETLRTALGCSS